MRWHKPHSLLGVEAGNRVADEQADRFPKNRLSQYVHARFKPLCQRERIR
jgi:hypothetical protein